MPPEIDATEAKQLVRQVEKIGGRDLGRLLQKAIDGETPFAAGTQASNIADAVVAHDITGVDGTGSNAASKAETDSALDALGVKVNAVLAALEEFGITAAS